MSCSVDIAPKWGEYERTTATALNAYIGPVMAKYLGQPRPAAEGVGLRPAAADHAVRRRLDLGRSRDGVAAAHARLGSGVGRHRFAVPRQARWACRTSSPPTWAALRSTSASSHGGQPEYSFVSNVVQYEYFLPRGRHPGDRLGRRLARPRRHGFEDARASARSRRAPIRDPCATARAARQPTVTDADVVLGTINPDNFLGGRIKLDRKKAVEAVQRVADRAQAIADAGGERRSRRSPSSRWPTSSAR